MDQNDPKEEYYYTCLKCEAHYKTEQIEYQCPVCLHVKAEDRDEFNAECAYMPQHN
jgi:rubrerythrin